MSDYTELSTDDQFRIVQAKLRQFEQNHLVAVIDAAAAEASGETEQAAELTEQANQWALCAAATRKTLDGMKPPAVPNRAQRRARTRNGQAA